MQHFLLETPVDVSETLNLISRAKHTYVKFLSANDLGLTGSHQRGIYLSRDCWPFFLDAPGPAGENLERLMNIDWGDGRRTPAMFKWYGASKKEYRITQTTALFRHREERSLGALFLLLDASDTHGELLGRILESDDDIEQVLNFLGITPAETAQTLNFDLNERLLPECEKYLLETGGSFPDTADISRRSQRVFEELYGDSGFENPDRALLSLIEIEYTLFRSIERQVYEPLLNKAFGRIEDLLVVSLEINNRRKSRAGLALENHLKYLFERLRVPHIAQGKTEDQRRPDFIFPGQEAYDDPQFPSERLFFLGAKTTCKDRWRQVLNEADRIPVKYLCTLQQGFSTAQLGEMHAAGVIPVIPAAYHSHCKEADRAQLMTVSQFIDRVLEKNGTTPDLFAP
ncbi:MAG: type II restriction endonuclease [bacterium]|nr:type II restriction endonuclease [bacterium]